MSGRFTNIITESVPKSTRVLHIKTNHRSKSYATESPIEKTEREKRKKWTERNNGQNQNRLWHDSPQAFPLHHPGHSHWQDALTSAEEPARTWRTPSSSSPSAGLDATFRSSSVVRKCLPELFINGKELAGMGAHKITIFAELVGLSLGEEGHFGFIRKYKKVMSVSFYT